MLKKKLAAAALAAVAALSLVAVPVSAFAADSPNTVTSTTSDNKKGIDVVAGATAKKTRPDGYIKVTPSDGNASNVPSSETGRVVASFTIDQDGVEGPYTFTFNLGPKYAGSTVTIYVEYVDGTTEVLTKVADANGVVTFTTDKQVARVTLCADESNGTAPATDTSARSPQTGVDVTAVAGLTAAATAGAGVVACSIRKKVRE